MKQGFLGSSPCQIGSNNNENTEGLHSMSIFQAQMKHDEIANLLLDNTLNECRSLILLACQVNEDFLCYYQAMKADN